MFKNNNCIAIIIVDSWKGGEMLCNYPEMYCLCALYFQCALTFDKCEHIFCLSGKNCGPNQYSMFLKYRQRHSVRNDIPKIPCS